MKKILFVCSGNVGRSQMAEAFYNYYSESKDAISAGTDPDTSIKYPEIPKEIRQIMLEEGIDISLQKVKLIDKRLVERADRIFVMCEKVLCPDFLVNSRKIVFWVIKDPYQMSLDGMRKIRDQIKAKVKTII